VDIDECAEGTHTCQAPATCTDLDGDFRCDCLPPFVGDGAYGCRCPDGYEPYGYGCRDIDECLLRTDRCSDFADCINQPGDYDCTCKPGYTGDGWTCTPI
jgi:hypothetical protein